MGGGCEGPAIFILGSSQVVVAPRKGGARGEENGRRSQKMG